MSDREHLLFVCTANQQRSPTAESLFDDDDRYEARSCGTHAFGGTPCSGELLEWADTVFCMEQRHRRELLREFPEAGDSDIIVLDIPDIYVQGDPELIRLLKKGLDDWW